MIMEPLVQGGGRDDHPSVRLSIRCTRLVQEIDVLLIFG